MSVKYTSDHPELGQSPDDGFDCSGFARYVLERSGLHIPHYFGQDGVVREQRHANELWDHYGVAVHEMSRQPGDLIFFSRNGLFPTHIGIVYDESRYIHAPGTNGSHVSVETIVPENISPRPDGQHILYAHNPIGYKSPVIAMSEPTYRYHQKPLE